MRHRFIVSGLPESEQLLTISGKTSDPLFGLTMQKGKEAWTK
jgi:hypothetical protein